VRPTIGRPIFQGNGRDSHDIPFLTPNRSCQRRQPRPKPMPVHSQKHPRHVALRTSRHIPGFRIFGQALPEIRRAAAPRGAQSPTPVRALQAGEVRRDPPSHLAVPLEDRQFQLPCPKATVAELRGSGNPLEPLEGFLACGRLPTLRRGRIGLVIVSTGRAEAMIPPRFARSGRMANRSPDG